jgi:hypothetical protein
MMASQRRLTTLECPADRLRMLNSYMHDCSRTAGFLNEWKMNTDHFKESSLCFQTFYAKTTEAQQNTGVWTLAIS